MAVIGRLIRNHCDIRGSIDLELDRLFADFEPDSPGVTTVMTCDNSYNPSFSFTTSLALELLAFFFKQTEMKYLHVCPLAGHLAFAL